MEKYKKFNTILSFLTVVSFCITSCNMEIDNWDYPSSQISGQFLYNGEPVRIMGTASEVSNMLQLSQTGPGNWDPGFIKMNAREDGSYTVTTFDGDYFLVITPGRGPWVANTDTIRFSLKGQVSDINFNVTPYYWISDYSTSFQDSLFTATFNLEKVVQTAELEKVVVYLGTTAIIDNISRISEKAFTSVTPGNVTFTFDLKTLSAKDKKNLRGTGFLFARVGVKTKGSTDLLYSITERLSQ